MTSLERGCRETVRNSPRSSVILLQSFKLQLIHGLMLSAHGYACLSVKFSPRLMTATTALKLKCNTCIPNVVIEINRQMGKN